MGHRDGAPRWGVCVGGAYCEALAALPSEARLRPVTARCVTQPAGPGRAADNTAAATRLRQDNSTGVQRSGADHGTIGP